MTSSHVTEATLFLGKCHRISSTIWKAVIGVFHFGDVVFDQGDG